MVVFDSADLDSTVEGIVDAIWFNQGQVGYFKLQYPLIIFNPLSPNIKMHNIILLTLFSIFFMLPVGRISFNIKTFHLW